MDTISIAISVRHVHLPVATVLLRAVLPAYRDISLREVLVFLAPIAASPVRMPLPVASVHQGQFCPKVPVWHVLPTAIHASILLSARFVRPITQ